MGTLDALSRARHSSVDAHRALLLPDVGDDVVHLVRRQPLDRWHGSEVPVVLLHAALDGDLEGSVRVVAGLVHVVQVRRPEVGAPQVDPVTPSAVVGVQRSASAWIAARDVRCIAGRGLGTTGCQQQGERGEDGTSGQGGTSESGCRQTTTVM